MRWLRKHKSEVPKPGEWDLSTPLLYWADDVAWTIGAACEGTQIFGSTGSSKSTGSLARIILSFLVNGFGGIFFTAKREDREFYTQQIRAAGRLDDLLIFSRDSDLRFNFIDAEMRQASGPLGLVENLTALLMTVAQLFERAGNSSHGGGQNEAYFRAMAATLARNSLLAVVLGSERVTMQALHRFITSAPRSRRELANPEFQKNSFCIQCLLAADDASKDDALQADFDLAETFFLSEWPSLGSRLRGSVQRTLMSALDLLCRGAAREMLSSPNPNVSPEMMYDGKIMIVDFPVLVDRDIGRLIQVILKYCWQRAHSRRNVADNPRPTFMVSDESHLLLVDADHLFATTARSTRTAIVNATQSFASYLDALGPHSEPKVATLLGNLQTQVFHQQTDIKTIEYVQQLVGRSTRYTMSGNSNGGDWLAPLLGQSGHTSAGFNEIYEFELQAADLNSLAKGGPPHFTASAIVYQGGRRFPNGRTWLPVSFKQILYRPEKAE